MAKKKKKARKTKKAKKRERTEKVKVEMQPVLVDNFVALQKVMVNLASKFDNVNTQLTKLLDIFETSAKTLAKKGFKLEAGESTANEEVIGKLNELSEQNKIIAKGLTLMHEVATAEPVMMAPPAPMPMPAMPMPPAPTPFPRLPKQGAPAPAVEGGYKKSAPFKEGKPQGKVPAPPK